MRVVWEVTDRLPVARFYVNGELTGVSEMPSRDPVTTLTLGDQGAPLTPTMISTDLVRNLRVYAVN